MKKQIKKPASKPVAKPALKQKAIAQKKQPSPDKSKPDKNPKAEKPVRNLFAPLNTEKPALSKSEIEGNVLNHKSGGDFVMIHEEDAVFIRALAITAGSIYASGRVMMLAKSSLTAGSKLSQEVMQKAKEIRSEIKSGVLVIKGMTLKKGR